MKHNYCCFDYTLVMIFPAKVSGEMNIFPDVETEQLFSEVLPKAKTVIKEVAATQSLYVGFELD